MLTVLALPLRTLALSSFLSFPSDYLSHHIINVRGRSIGSLVLPASLAPSTDVAGLAQGSMEHADAVICGGGPAGLLSAIMLAQKLPSSTSIRVYDRLSEPPNPDDEMAWSDVGK